MIKNYVQKKNENKYDFSYNKVINMLFKNT